MDGILTNIDKDLKIKKEDNNDGQPGTTSQSITDTVDTATEPTVQDITVTKVITEDGTKDTVDTIMLKQIKSLTDAVTVLTDKIQKQDSGLQAVKSEMAQLFFNPSQDGTVNKDKKIGIDDLIDSGVINSIL